MLARVPPGSHPFRRRPASGRLDSRDAAADHQARGESGQTAAARARVRRRGDRGGQVRLGLGIAASLSSVTQETCSRMFAIWTGSGSDPRFRRRGGRSARAGSASRPPRRCGSGLCSRISALDQFLARVGAHVLVVPASVTWGKPPAQSPVPRRRSRLRCWCRSGRRKPQSATNYPCNHGWSRTRWFPPDSSFSFNRDPTGSASATFDSSPTRSPLVAVKRSYSIASLTSSAKSATRKRSSAPTVLTASWNITKSLGQATTSTGRRARERYP